MTRLKPSQAANPAEANWRAGHSETTGARHGTLSLVRWSQITNNLNWLGI